MIRYTAKLSDGSKKTIECITSWDEMSFRQLLELEKAREDLDVISIFSIIANIEYVELANMKDKKVLDALEGASRFIYNEPLWGELPAADELVLGDKKYKVLKNLEEIKFGQRVLLKQLAGKENIIEALPEAIAILMIDEIYGEFNQETQKKIPDVLELVLNAKALDIYPIGQFFFLHSEMLRSIGQSYLIKSQNLMTPIKQ